MSFHRCLLPPLSLGERERFFARWRRATQVTCLKTLRPLLVQWLPVPVDPSFSPWRCASSHSDSGNRSHQPTTLETAPSFALLKPTRPSFQIDICFAGSSFRISQVPRPQDNPYLNRLQLAFRMLSLSPARLAPTLYLKLTHSHPFFIAFPPKLHIAAVPTNLPNSQTQGRSFYSPPRWPPY